MAATKTTYTATYNGDTETRTSTRAYTHAAVYMVGSDNRIVIGSWHASEALALKGTNGMKPVAVVPATAK